MKVDTPPHLFGQGPMKVDTPPHLFGQGPMKVDTPPHLVGQGPATSRHPKNIVLTTGNAMGNGRVTLTVELITRYPMFNILFESLSDMSFVKLENVFAIKNPAENCIFFVGYHHHQEDIKATLATAESIIKINPLRLDNIKVCGGNPPVLYLGEETADGFGKRVAVRLVQEGDTNWGLGFDNVIV
ncbi:hypothetical protein FOL47_000693 [Perkinsus chesapeaki]|uniref:Uncharacterized protein n=1 Tax=Perkinsus chesapeaki TaxID=330153 RepID=A0A7J6ML31_PERCH|nr:hypothetical protein FOL47_000693 [Perkinsus chesapeaki]